MNALLSVSDKTGIAAFKWDVSSFEDCKAGMEKVVAALGPVDVIVNAWNRNIIPWWLLLPQGVSGAIKRRAGKQPFREVARHGPIPLGGAVLTSAGSLPYAGIIHVDDQRHDLQLCHPTTGGPIARRRTGIITL